MRAVAHGWKPRGKKSKDLPPEEVARKFMKAESQKSKVKTPQERAKNLMLSLAGEVESQNGEAKFLKAGRLENFFRMKADLKREAPLTGLKHWEPNKSQKSGDTDKSQNESFTTKKDAWRKGIVTNIPDRKTMYFTGKQTAYDTAVVFRQAIKVK